MFSFMMDKKIATQAAHESRMSIKLPRKKSAHTPAAPRAEKLPQRKARNPRKWSTSLGHGGPFFPFY